MLHPSQEQGEAAWEPRPSIPSARIRDRSGRWPNGSQRVVVMGRVVNARRRRKGRRRKGREGMEEVAEDPD
eukprot:1344329-Rhodomonas_salina.2